MKTIALRIYLFLLMFAFTASVASAGTYTVPAGNGTLGYTATVYIATCHYVLGAHVYPFNYYETTYSSFSFILSGTTTPLTGGVSTVDDPEPPPIGNKDCPKSNFPKITLFSPGVGIEFTPSGETSGAATILGSTGYINPKYVVLGVTYAPPGNQSYVQYAGSTMVGTSTSLNGSFSSNVGLKIAVANTTGVKGTLPDSGGTYGWNDTETNTFPENFTV
jgi:hypothetical protein